MPIIKCYINRSAIEKATRQQRELKQKIILLDPSGLRLAVNSRSASWNYNYRKRGVDYQGKRHPQRTLRLGDTLNMTPQEARLKVEQVKSEVRNGGDPAFDLAKAAAISQHVEYKNRPLSQLLKEYKDYLFQVPSQHKQKEIMHAGRALKELSIQKISASSVTARMFREINTIHSDKPSTARHRFGALSRFLDYLVDEGMVERNPAKDVSRRHRPKASNPRETYYSANELKKLWSPEDGLRPDYLRYLRFMIVCPLRMTEASELTTKNIDFEALEIHLSAEETKNRTAFTLPLPELAFNILNIKNFKQDERIFQLSSVVGSPMKSWSFFNKEVRKASGIINFNLHNLRRSFSSLISEHSEISESLVDSLLNHKRSSTRAGVMRHYMHAKNLKQRREVMNWWVNFLEEEVINFSKEKVVS